MTREESYRMVEAGLAPLFPSVRRVGIGGVMAIVGTPGQEQEGRQCLAFIDSGEYGATDNWPGELAKAIAEVRVADARWLSPAP